MCVVLCLLPSPSSLLPSLPPSLPLLLPPSLPPSVPQVHEDEIDKQLWGEMKSMEEEEEVGHVTPSDVM